MPIYTYRREDGTTFDIRQKFSDDPLEVDPKTGQRVHRVPQASGIIFKGSGFYVTDARGSNSAVSNGSSAKATTTSDNGSSENNSSKAGETAKTASAGTDAAD